jgi:hypothetical protein
MKLNLSLASWLFLLFLGGISIYLVVRNPSDILLLPGFFLPPILVLYIFYFRRLRQEISLDVVVANFACGFLPGAIVVVIVEALLALSLFLFFFSDQLQVGLPLLFVRTSFSLLYCRPSPLERISPLVESSRSNSKSLASLACFPAFVFCDCGTVS